MPVTLVVQNLIMGHYFGADRGPIEQPLRIGGEHVDAAVAHRLAEIVMPVGAVQPIIALKIHHIRDTGQKIFIIARAA